MTDHEIYTMGYNRGLCIGKQSILRADPTTTTYTLVDGTTAQSRSDVFAALIEIEEHDRCFSPFESLAATLNSAPDHAWDLFESGLYEGLYDAT